MPAIVSGFFTVKRATSTFNISERVNQKESAIAVAESLRICRLPWIKRSESNDESLKHSETPTSKGEVPGFEDFNRYSQKEMHEHEWSVLEADGAYLEICRFCGVTRTS